MAENVRIDQLAAAVMDGLKEYANLATEDLKKAVRKAGTSVKKDIQENAPKDTGTYAQSWTVKKIKESANSLELVLHSRNRYQLSHLLEFGHAKRGGGRVSGKAHIAPAEERAVETLEQEIEKALRG